MKLKDVTDRYRSRGIGKQLYDKLIDKFLEIGCKSLALEVFYDNSESVQLYKKIGFAEDSMFMKKLLVK